MSELAVQINGISKMYKIAHGKKAMKGTATFKDAVAEIGRKPIEILTGHRVKKESFWALKDVSFEVEKGVAVGIVGRNGSGKSTLLKILSRIVEPTEGEARMFGRTASLLEVGTGFHPELTGRENIFLNGAVLGMRRKEIITKFDEIVAFSEVEKFLDTPVKYYSSGMYVRLAFAVAAHLDPDILIVDEVLAVGDAAFQKKCLGKMESVTKEGRTVLFVSHNADALRNLCDQAVLLENGKVVAKGKINDVLEKYSMSRTDKTGHFRATEKRSEDVQIMEVVLKNSRGETTNQFDVAEPIFVHVSYDIRKPKVGAIIGIELCSIEGTPLTASYDHASLGQHPGSYRTQLEIPANFLTRKQFYLNAIFEAPGIMNYDRSAELAFECYQFSGEENKITGSFGYFADNLKWHQIKS